MLYRKSLGQNFLTSRDVAQELVGAADIGQNDTVVEVGPGGGMVTQYIVNECKQLIAVEYDERFIKMLKNRFLDDSNFRIIHKDILTFEPDKFNLSQRGYKVIGSLPYNISKKIIKKFLEEKIQPESITVIIQKEVAEDYSADVPKATFLSNYIQIYGRCDFLQVVSKSDFNPQPKVDGAIIRINLTKFPKYNAKKFSKFLKNAFMNPRKKLLNNLSSYFKLEKERLKEIFSSLEIDSNSRASNLEFEVWEKLYQKVLGKNKTT